jgi:hypothetical protein
MIINKEQVKFEQIKKVQRFMKSVPEPKIHQLQEVVQEFKRSPLAPLFGLRN